MKIIKTTILALTLCVMIQFSHAQIVYTNVQPDQKLSCNKFGCTHTYLLDLNNDGIIDFNLTAMKNGQDFLYSLGVSEVTLSGNAIAGNASALSSGATIDGGVTWTASSAPLRQYVDFSSMGGPMGFSGNWTSNGDKYLGLKIQVGPNQYYGWARLTVSVSTSGASFTIKDYAYDSTPNHSIHAGATSGARMAEENLTNENNLPLNAFPNPVSNSTTISFSLRQSQHVCLKIVDVSGRLVSTLADKIFEAGENEITWNAAEVNAGIYFLQFQTSENLQTKKLIVTK